MMRVCQFVYTVKPAIVNSVHYVVHSAGILLGKQCTGFYSYILTLYSKQTSLFYKTDLRLICCIHCVSFTPL